MQHRAAMTGSHLHDRVYTPAPRTRRLDSIDYGPIARYVPPPRAEDMLLVAYAELVLARRIEHGLRDYHSQESLLRTHILPAFGADRISALDALPGGEPDPGPRQRILEWHRAIRAQRSSSTADNAYGALRVLLRAAEDDGLVRKTPCTLRAEDRGPRTTVDPLHNLGHVHTRAELRRLLTTSQIPVVERVWYTLLAFTGMRFGEAAALRWSRVDLSARRIEVVEAWSSKRKRSDPPKTGEPRQVALHATLVRALAHQRDVIYPELYECSATADDLVCPRVYRGEILPRRPESSLRRYQRHSARLGLAPLTQHDFRATLISLAEEDGADRAILERMTHRAGGQLAERGAYERYVRYSLQSMIREIDRLDLDIPAPAQQYQLEGIDRPRSRRRS